MLSSATAVLAGIHSLGVHPSAVDSHGEPIMVSMASYLPDDMPLVERMEALAAGAIDEALAPLSALQDEKREPIPLVLGLPIIEDDALKTLERELKERLRRRYEEQEPFSSIQTILAGNAAGMMAMEKAWRVIADQQLPMCLAGGVDSYMDPAVLTRLDERGLLSTERNPRGLRPAEGAGICLLATPGAVPKLWSLGRIVSMATTVEERPIRSEVVIQADGLSNAWAQVLEALEEGETIEIAGCDQNGEPFRAQELEACISQHWEHFDERYTYLSPNEQWGDVGAASGPLLVAAAFSARAGDYTKGKRALLWTSSEGGERCAAVVRM